MADTEQTFVITHDQPGAFKSDGLRDYALYRSLGMEAATRGLVQAHVIRMAKPFNAAEVSIPHRHRVQFQMVYCLKGWIRSEFEGQGVQELRAGSCWLQPAGIKHTVIGYSDDCEVLEINMPAEFETELAEPAPATAAAR